MTNLPDIRAIKTDTVDGLRIRYATGGASIGTPILLTSPWPESLYAFRDVLPKIDHLGPWLALDIPGFGQSQGRADLFSPRAMGRFIIRFAEQLGLARLHAVGPDVGTSALLFAAAEKEDLFESIVCGAGATSVDLAGPLLRDLILSPPGHFSAMEGGAFVVDLIRGATAKVIPDAVLDDYRASSAGDRFEKATAYVRAYQSDLPALKPLLADIRTPVLVLAGKDDPVVPPPNGELLVKGLPHCRQTLLAAGHFAWEDQAGAYADELVSWILGGYRSV